MSFFSKLFGHKKNDTGNSQSSAQSSADLETVIRRVKKQDISVLQPDKKEVDKPPIFSLQSESGQLADDKSKSMNWEVKTLPVYEVGDEVSDLYQIEDVRSGAMGHVYIATHKKWKIKLAIKAPNEEILAEPDFYARAIREAKSWTELGLHPNIAYCYYVRNSTFGVVSA